MKDLWIKAGAECFIKNNSMPRSIKELTEYTQLKRTTFYRYFSDLDDLVQNILDYFIQSTRDKVPCFLNCNTWNEVLKLLCENKNILFYKSYLTLLKQTEQKYIEVLTEIASIIRPILLPIWAKHYNLQVSDPEKAYFNSMAVFHVRINHTEINYDNMKAIHDDIINISKEV